MKSLVDVFDDKVKEAAAEDGERSLKKGMVRSSWKDCCNEEGTEMLRMRKENLSKKISWQGN